MKKKLLLLMCILTFACSACSSADAGNTEETVEANPEEVQAELEDISINADVSQTYDINTEVPVEISTTPEDFALSASSFVVSGGKISENEGSFVFTSSEEGTFTIYAESGEIKSNELTISFEDKKAKEAALKAQKEQEAAAAREKQAQEEATEATRKVWNFEEGVLAEGATRELCDIATQKIDAVTDASVKDSLNLAVATATASIEQAEQAAAEEARRQAEAAAQAEAARIQAEQEAQLQQQEDVGGTVYWTSGGEVYHSTLDCPTLGRSKNIFSGSISESGKSRPCKVCY